MENQRKMQLDDYEIFQTLGTGPNYLSTSPT